MSHVCDFGLLQPSLHSLDQAPRGQWAPLEEFRTIDQSAEPVESFPALFMADPGTPARGHQTRNVLVSYTASTLVVCLVILVAVGSCRRLVSNSSSNSRKLDLTVVVPCDRFRHTRDNTLLHTPLIDVPWLFPSSSQDECSVLTRRALVSLSAQTRISVGNLDDLVTPRLFGCEAGCARTLGTSSRPAVILSQEAYGILLLPLHSNRIDCCLSLSCV